MQSHREGAWIMKRRGIALWVALLCVGLLTLTMVTVSCNKESASGDGDATGTEETTASEDGEAAEEERISLSPAIEPAPLPEDGPGPVTPEDLEEDPFKVVARAMGQMETFRVTISMSTRMGGADTSDDAASDASDEADEAASGWGEFAEGGGLWGMNNSSGTVTMAQPNLFRLEQEDSDGVPSVVSDGEDMVVYDDNEELYTKTRSPKTLTTLTMKVLEVGGYQAMMGMGHLISGLQMALGELGDDYANYAGMGDTSYEYQGTVEIDGHECHEVMMVISMGQAWGVTSELSLAIDAGEWPVLRRLEAVTKYEQTDYPTSDMAQVYEFSDWEMNPELPEGTFSFVPPEGAEESEDGLDDGLGDLFSSALQQEMGMSELLGEDAPNFALPVLDGERFQLTEHEGQIVVLDFFTTWADDVGKVLKAHGQVAEEYADQGVVYLAVNQSESEEVVRALLESADLNVPVALDNGAVVGTLYERQDMPYTVIIGEDGTVEQVTTTYGADPADELRESIDTLLEGESLAEAAMASQFT
ncbi:MAG: DUF2092 domain-containing protein [Armatimonadia bacterium]|nr:DUF2092 domain-containing protein [Armatimonadia bacterium]